MSSSPLLRALKDKKMSMADIARSLSVQKSTVTRWFQRQIPPERAHAVERVTGIPVHELRPDLWSPPEETNKQEQVA